MQRYLFLFFLCYASILYSQTDNLPVTGVSDKRPEIYGFRNAKIVIDYQTTVENTDFLVVDGRIIEVGQKISFPAGTIVYDLSGKTVYPSFIDVYAGNYGIKAASGSNDTNPFAAMMNIPQQGRQMGSSATEPRTADYWNDGINASYNITDEFIPDTKTAGEFRQSGFGAVVTFKADGIARGTSALVSTGDGRANSLIIKNRASANYSFTRGRSADIYPLSQLGVIALLRQFNYDAQWYKQLPPGYYYDEGLESYLSDSELPQIFEAGNKTEIMRACQIGREFNIRYIIKGAGDEYQALDDVKKCSVKLIVPVRFPEVPDLKDPFDAASVEYTTLKHYDMAPGNLSALKREGIVFAITSSGLERKSDFLSNLRKAVKYGLPENEALKSLTEIPAEMIGASGLLGALRKNMIANFLITSGNIFNENCIIYENWIQGKPYRFVDIRIKDLRGSYSLKVDTTDYRMVLSGTPDKLTVKITFDSTEARGATFTNDKGLVNISFESSGTKYRLSGYLSDTDLSGRGQLENGRWFAWKAVLQSTSRGENGKTPGQASIPLTGTPVHPFAAYGYRELPVQEEIVFKNATVWTNEKEGKLLNYDVLVSKGKISKIGRDISAPSARVIDATGMHLTPGIIDEHSHIAMDGTNEGGQAITSEVRVGDVIDPEDPSIYRQLSGGVTAAHILHGSANPIGGQSILIKHRWGHSAEELKIENQAGFLKHALGENVKRTSGRYPNSRMGVDQIIRDAYNRAIDYNNKWKAWNSIKPADRTGKIPPRRDLELDAIVDVLEKRSFIECHTYVQSEGTMIMDIAKDYAVRVNSLIHFNEGYKIADQIKENKAGASVFSDWWDYKYEVYEGITYNASVLLSQGILTCLHSDDAEMGRRLNQEAGKIMKYGGISDTAALKLVTLNPAKLLHLDDCMGSIRTGKDADLVLWTDNPLSIYARASKTMVDGIIYFDEEIDAKMKLDMDKERNRIISNILKESSRPSPANQSNFPRR